MPERSSSAILAGGLGTRLGALTATTPKPVLEVGGRPFLAWIMGELVRFGVSEVLLLTARMREQGLAPHRLSVGSSLNMYWTAAQILTHHASNGSPGRRGVGAWTWGK